MVVPGGTVVVSVVRTIVLGGRDGGGQGTVVGRAVNEMIKCTHIHMCCRVLFGTCMIMHSIMLAVIPLPLAGLIVTIVILL